MVEGDKNQEVIVADPQACLDWWGHRTGIEEYRRIIEPALKAAALSVNKRRGDLPKGCIIDEKLSAYLKRGAVPMKPGELYGD